ncbi:MAG: lactonase family protein [Kiritimatiellia bacterium]|jgi:6-phosphogluconolactonase
MKTRFYVGSSSGEAKAGLRVFEINSGTGAIRQISQVDDAMDPTYLAVSADGRFLYSTQRMAPNSEGWSGGVAVYAVKGDTLEKVAEHLCAPGAPCHLSLSHNGRQLVWAEYGKAWSGAFAVGDDGLLKGASARVRHTGKGPNPARQEAAHSHCAVTTPDDSRICVCDLGIDQVVVYDAEAKDGALRRIEGAGFRSAPGAGPRHIIFHPTADFAFLLCELDSTMVSLRHLGGGAFEEVGTYTMLPAGFSGETKAAAVKVSPDGRWVLGSNRGCDSVAAYRLDVETGRLDLQAISPLNGSFPRDFEFTPDGRFVVLGHKLSNEVAVYAFDGETGRLAQVANTVSMIKPLCFVFER